MPEGETPHHIQLQVFDDLCDSVKPGDRIEVVGVYRAQGLRVNSNRLTMKNIFNTYLDAISFKKTAEGRIGVEVNQEDGAD